MINQKILYDLCESFIKSSPKPNLGLSLELALQDSNILDINLPRACGKTNVATEIALAYPSAIIVPANRCMLRGGYYPLSKDRLVSHTQILESYIRGITPCPFENRIIILDDCTKVTPEDIIREYIIYPHHNRTPKDLIWRAPKVIALGTRYKL